MAARRPPLNRRERRHPEHIGLQQAAERCGVSYRTVRRWIAKGEIDAVRVGPRLLKVDAAAVDALIQPVGAVASYPDHFEPIDAAQPQARTVIASPRAPNRKTVVAERLAQLDTAVST
jgi:excisionase family DNA binding protein